jgi:hypothetical protein
VEAFLPGYGAEDGQLGQNRTEIIRADGRRIPVSVYQRSAMTPAGTSRRVIVIHEIGRLTGATAGELAGDVVALAAMV